MKIKKIDLMWFRGAADVVSLQSDCKSMVVYGQNGSGKSSFVDAFEYALRSGKIGHLAHEYSGKHQEKAIINTHRPKSAKAEVRIQFENGAELKAEIGANGALVLSGAGGVAIKTWDYARTVLRQDEVAHFIQDTKGNKYSVLLPLLGLGRMEVTAENLRQLARSVEGESKLEEIQRIVNDGEVRRKDSFCGATDEKICETIEILHKRYVASSTNDPLTQCLELEPALEAKIAQYSGDQRRHLALRAAAEVGLKTCVDHVRSTNSKLAAAAEPLIAERLGVLQSARAYSAKLGKEGSVNCPACGRPVATKAFLAHVDSERKKLQESVTIFQDWKTALGRLCDAVKLLRSSLARPEVKEWRDDPSNAQLLKNLAWLNGFDADAIRVSCTEEELKAIEDKLLALVDAAGLVSKTAPAEVTQLSVDKKLGDAAKTLLKAREREPALVRLRDLVAFVKSIEDGVREEIRARSQTMVEEISEDIEKMWSIFHPGEGIERVHLYIPEDTDKAIDIALKFYGVEQDSPRLTLSEGYRNSLGLCIFLAMAKSGASEDQPLFLDDVVVSLDRNHRGMIVELLEKEFSDRQVIIFTHDREWYTELRQQLDEKKWIFRALLPYSSPEVGIRWFHKTSTFGDARAQLDERPDSAGNDARKIMDVELALIAERLHIAVPYMRGDKNDRRMAHDFLGKLIADGKKCFQKRSGKDYVSNPDAIEALDSADRLIVSTANRASHSFDVVGPESAKLIDNCERALESFKCSSCGRNVWFADAEGSEWVQCQCGALRWRYGKA